MACVSFSWHGKRHANNGCGWTGAILQMNSGDILGHEFCGVVEQVGPGIKKVKPGKRYVASFQIACGDVCSLDVIQTPLLDKTLIAYPVLLLQAKTLIAMRKDKLQHHRQGHVRRSNSRHIRILPFDWRLRWRTGRIRAGSSWRCQSSRDSR